MRTLYTVQSRVVKERPLWCLGPLLCKLSKYASPTLACVDIDSQEKHCSHLMEKEMCVSTHNIFHRWLLNNSLIQVNVFRIIFLLSERDCSIGPNMEIVVRKVNSIRSWHLVASPFSASYQVE